MAESKKNLMLERGAEYLNLVRSAPGEHPAEIKALAEYVSVSRRLFYKADPEIQQMVATLEELREATHKAASLEMELEDGRLEAATDTELASDLKKAVERAVWAMKKFIGQRGRGEAPEEPGLAAYDLDVCMGQLRAVQQELRPLVAEIERRESTGGDPASTPADAQGFLGDFLDR